MKISSMLLKRCVTAGVMVPFVSAPIVAQGALDDVVLLWGNSDEGPEMVGRLDTGATMTAEGVCNTANWFINANFPTIASAASVLGSVGVPIPAVPGVPQLDCEDSSFSGETYFIFTTCSMIMGQGSNWMRWTVPPLAPEASMTYIDPSTNQGYRLKLETALDQVNQNSSMALGSLLDSDITDTGGEKSVTLNVSLTSEAYTAREYTARTYNFGYEGSIAPMGGPQLGALLQVGRIESRGDADIVADAPGADVISQFYANFRDNVVPSTGASSLYGAMMRQMADLASRGIPVRVTQTNSAGIGLSTMIGGAGYGSESTSTSTIDRIMVLPGRAATTCGATVFPEGMAVVDLAAQMAEASAAAAASTNEMNEMLEGMSEEDLAMLQQFGGGLGQMFGGAAAAGGAAAGTAGGAASEMTPEQQAAMQQVNGLLGGLLGGAAAVAGGGAGATPGAAATGATAGAAVPTVARSGSSLSSALMTDNVTQSAQNMLGALGYDPGNTDGELSIETTIAISQFQAEQGLEVTGEVTPQLLGILAARVDAL